MNGVVFVNNNKQVFFPLIFRCEKNLSRNLILWELNRSLGCIICQRVGGPEFLFLSVNLCYHLTLLVWFYSSLNDTNTVEIHPSFLKNPWECCVLKYWVLLLYSRCIRTLKHNRVGISITGLGKLWHDVGLFTGLGKAWNKCWLDTGLGKA